jgi:hypothetical protein
MRSAGRWISHFSISPWFPPWQTDSRSRPRPGRSFSGGVPPRYASPGAQGSGLLSTFCVCGCLWSDILREGSGMPEGYENHLLGRIAEEEAQRSALTKEG